MKYTQNERYNKFVSKCVQDLKEEIVSQFQPRSIILTGSFGKSEVTIFESNNGELSFSSDCEVIIIPKNYILSSSKISEFKKAFFERKKLQLSPNAILLTLQITIPFLRSRMKPTMFNYDLKFGSKVIFGEDYISKMPIYDSKDIPLQEGIRLLLNRMAEAAGNFSFGSDGPHIGYLCDKILIACQDALLLTIGKYHFSYKKRNELFNQHFNKEFKEIFLNPEHTLKMINTASSNKIEGLKTSVYPPSYYFEVQQICDPVFRHCIKKEMHFEFDSYSEFQSLYLNHFKNFCVMSLIKKMYYWLKISKSLRIPIKRLVFPMDVPFDQYIYAITPIVYFMLSQNNGIDQKKISQTEKCLLSLNLIDTNREYVSNDEKFRIINDTYFRLWYHTFN